MNPNLLQVVPAPPLVRKNSIALMQEFPVDPSSYPYLVSASAKPFLWVERPLRVVRAVIRKGQDVPAIFQEVLEFLVQRAGECFYGNLFPCTDSGVLGALQYVSYYLEGGSSEVVNPLYQLMEILVSPGSPWAGGRESLNFNGTVVSIQEASWVPESTVIVVPADRGFLGDLHLYGDSSFAVVVHNPSRGVAVARGES